MCLSLFLLKDDLCFFFFLATEPDSSTNGTMVGPEDIGLPLWRFMSYDAVSSRTDLRLLDRRNAMNGADLKP